MEKERVVYLLTASEITDIRQVRFLDELTQSAIACFGPSVYVHHHISYHSQIDCALAEFSAPTFNRILHREKTALSQFDHLERIMSSVHFSDDDVLVFCDDDDYFFAQVPLPRGDVAGYQGLQLIPEGELFDGSLEELQAKMRQAPDFASKWHHDVDFSGYSARARLVKQYFARRCVYPKALEDTQLMQFLDRHLARPDGAFVMHRLWRPLSQKGWVSTLLDEITNLVSIIDEKTEMNDEIRKRLTLAS